MENDNRIRIVEAMASYKARTGKDIEKELRIALQPEGNYHSRFQKMRKLKNGITTLTDRKTRMIICQYCMVDSNFLDGIEESSSNTNRTSCCHFDSCKMKTKKGKCRINCKHFAIK